MESKSEIQNFYSGANVFITGATGFLGRVLVEKLLRSCPDVGNIYLLVRTKKGKNLHERVENLLEDVIFDGLKENDPKFRHKITPIEGDVALKDLGINEQDRKLLTTEVSIVFHAAATVNFNEKLKIAVPINVCGTRDVLKLCHEMSNLKAVIHVSTAYSNCNQNVTEEKFYPTPIPPTKLIELVEVLPDELQEKITKGILKDFPNTYAYTKAIAENVVLEESSGLPIAIFRPAIVTSTYKEPIKAWINNLYGATGVIAGAYTGVLRVLQCNGDNFANIVPADMTVNAMISIAWDIQNVKNDSNSNIPIYNFDLTSQQPLTWNRFMTDTEKYGLNYPTIHAMWYYSFFLTTNKLIYLVSFFFLHYLPAIFGDLFLMITMKKPRLVKFYKKVQTFSSVLIHFCIIHFQFKSYKVREMIERMSVEDRTLFFCDLKKLDIEEYLKSLIPGIRVYLLKDSLNTLPQALKKWKRLYWCHQFMKIVALLIIVRIIFWFY
ncbi:fatty acyl-CoA reductase wat-like [Onthophagus taurus]|uniref:fatty acyl-CoA reductase wat-like n=1 Tax=Onthophagus taurus TaxID=166361 RepID=UPI0039BDBFBE